MEYSEKIIASKKARFNNMLRICTVGTVTCIGAAMAVYSLIRSNVLFALLYLAAVCMGLLYVIMRINSVAPLYMARDERTLYVQNWINGFFPFRTDKGFFGEFIPERTLIADMDIADIRKIYAGTKNYLSRIIPEGIFSENMSALNKRYGDSIKRMDFIYVCAGDGSEIYMPINDFDSEELGLFLKTILENNEKIDFKSNNRVINRQLPQKRFAL